ncbi:MAG: hypothetical protein WDW36_003627 [Sanguina aurantia]
MLARQGDASRETAVALIRDAMAHYSGASDAMPLRPQDLTDPAFGRSPASQQHTPQRPLQQRLEQPPHQPPRQRPPAPPQVDLTRPPAPPQVDLTESDNMLTDEATDLTDDRVGLPAAKRRKEGQRSQGGAGGGADTHRHPAWQGTAETGGCQAPGPQQQHQQHRKHQRQQQHQQQQRPPTNHLFSSLNLSPQIHRNLSTMDCTVANPLQHVVIQTCMGTARDVKVASGDNDRGASLAGSVVVVGKAVSNLLWVPRGSVAAVFLAPDESAALQASKNITKLIAGMPGMSVKVG